MQGICSWALERSFLEWFKSTNLHKKILLFIGTFYLLAFFHEIGHYFGMMLFQEYLPRIFFIENPLCFGWKVRMLNPPTIIGVLCYYLVIPIVLEIIVVFAAKKSKYWLLIIAFVHGSDISKVLTLIDCAII